MHLNTMLPCWGFILMDRFSLQIQKDTDLTLFVGLCILVKPLLYITIQFSNLKTIVHKLSHSLMFS